MQNALFKPKNTSSLALEPYRFWINFYVKNSSM